MFDAIVAWFIKLNRTTTTSTTHKVDLAQRSGEQIKVSSVNEGTLVIFVGKGVKPVRREHVVGIQVESRREGRQDVITAMQMIAVGQNWTYYVGGKRHDTGPVQSITVDR